MSHKTNSTEENTENKIRKIKKTITLHAVIFHTHLHLSNESRMVNHLLANLKQFLNFKNTLDFCNQLYYFYHQLNLKTDVVIMFVMIITQLVMTDNIPNVYVSLYLHLLYL